MQRRKTTMITPEQQVGSAERLENLVKELAAIQADETLPLTARSKLKTAGTLVLGASDVIRETTINSIKGEF